GERFAGKMDFYRTLRFIGRIALKSALENPKSAVDDTSSSGMERQEQDRDRHAASSGTARLTGFWRECRCDSRGPAARCADTGAGRRARADDGELRRCAVLPGSRAGIRDRADDGAGVRGARYRRSATWD